MPHTVLIVGADPRSAALAASAPQGEARTEQILAAVELQPELLRELGHTVDMSLVGMGGSESYPISAIPDGTVYDIVAVGAGIHRIPEFLPAFEAVMNALRRSPATCAAELCFSTAYDTVAEAVLRKIGELARSAN